MKLECIHVFLFSLHGATGHHKKNHMLTFVCKFKRGGATKMLIGRSCNNGEKNCLDLYRVSKCLNRNNYVYFVCVLNYGVCEHFSQPA